MADKTNEELIKDALTKSTDEKEEKKDKDVKDEKSKESSADDKEKSSEKDVKTEEDKDKKKDDPEASTIPRSRLNKEIERTKALETQVNALQSQITMLSTQIASGNLSKKDEKEKLRKIDDKVKRLVEEQDLDEKSAKNLATLIKEMIDEEVSDIKSKQSTADNDVSNKYIVKLAIKDALSQHPMKDILLRFEDDVYKEMMKFRNPQSRLNEEYIRESAHMIAGRKLPELLEENEKKTLKQHSEQAKIVVSGKEKASGSSSTGKTQLTDAQKLMAQKMKISEEDYIRGMSK